MKSRLIFILAVLSLGGCTIEDGNPWGTARFDLETRFDTDGRGDVRLRTAKDYDVELDELVLGVSTVRLQLTGAGEQLSFDPANPPSGYSLCHNGHCHSSDGRLVDYEDIEAELVTGGGGPELVGAVDGRVSFLSPEPIPVDCGMCDLERGSIQAATIELNVLSIRGRVWDRRVDARIPEGMAFEVEYPLNEALTSVIEGIDVGQDPLGVDVTGSLTIRARLLDQFDFADPTLGLEQPMLDAASFDIVTGRF